MPQLELFPLTPTDGSTIQERFERFHDANPWVYDALVLLARELKRRGRSRFGIKLLFERIRYESMLQTHGDEFKLNNNYHSRYARLIAEQEEDLADVFQLRELKA